MRGRPFFLLLLLFFTFIHTYMQPQITCWNRQAHTHTHTLILNAELLTQTHTSIVSASETKCSWAAWWQSLFTSLHFSSSFSSAYSSLICSWAALLRASVMDKGILRQTSIERGLPCCLCNELHSEWTSIPLLYLNIIVHMKWFRRSLPAAKFVP